jgi:hypothetical protein
MPIKNNDVYCVNHPNDKMLKNEGFNAITKFDIESSGFTFNPASGIPIVLYFCDKCGYVETYAAQKTKYWPAPKI